MAPYVFHPLDASKDEIRLLVLHPGISTGLLRGELRHESLTIPQLRPDPRLSLTELQNSVPQPWIVRETLERRYMFVNKDTQETSWRHPDPDISPDKYEGYGQDHDLAFEPKFEALSYVWGSPHNPEDLSLQGQQKIPSGQANVTLAIGQNLASALRHLRHPTESRVLWVDAICIDQNNIAERNLQVQRMRHIYKLACRVVVWLGPSAESSEMALSTLEYLGRQFEITAGQLLHSPEAERRDWGFGPQDIGALPYDDATWQALDRLFQRPWFERVWTIQEIQLASRFAVLQCGETVIPWPLARKAIRYLRRRASPLKSLQHRLRDLDMITLGLLRWTLPRLLTKIAAKKCTDPRDKIYGILSIQPPELARDVQVNYNLSASEVYRNSFLGYLEKTRRLDILRAVDAGSRLAGLPSWVPNWSQISRREVSDFFEAGYSASGNSSANASFQTPKSLNVTGVKLAQVIRVGESMTDDLLRAMRLIHELNAELSISQTLYFTGEPLGDALVKILTMGGVKDLHPSGTNYSSIAHWKELIKQLGSGRAYTAVALPYSGHDRSIIMTAEGYLGLAPDGTEEGDYVCVLLGCSMPIIIRQTTTAAQDFEVIGDCYLEGFMNGEALLGPLPPSWSVTMRWVDTGFNVPQYVGPDGISTLEDPRLETLAAEWEKVDLADLPNDPLATSAFRTKVTGEVLNSDPRMSIESLRARGINLMTFRLT